MKRAAAIFSIVISCVLLMGSAGRSATVLPSKSFYVNDYAGFLNDERRDFIRDIAEGVFENTGAQIVVLTVESLGGQTPEEYARDVFDGWEIGGGSGAGVLLLVPGDGEPYILVGHGLRDALTEAEADDIRSDELLANFEKGEYALGIIEGFKDIVIAVYAGYGKEAVFEESSGRGISDLGAYAICLAAVVLIALRGFRIGSRYKKKYAGKYVYKRKTYTRERIPDEDDYPSGFGGAVKVTVREPEDEDIDGTLPEADGTNNERT